MNDEVQTIPLTAYESLMTRMSRIVKWLIMGWALSVIALGLVLVISLSYSEEVMTETVTNDVEEEADDFGSNTFAGGDYYGSQTNGETDSYEDYEDEATGSGGDEADVEQASKD